MKNNYKKCSELVLGICGSMRSFNVLFMTNKSIALNNNSNRKEIMKKRFTSLRTNIKIFTAMSFVMLAMLGMTSSGHGAALTSWSLGQGTSASNLTTSSPAITALNVSIYNVTTPYTLTNIGDTLTFSGTVNLTLSNYTTNNNFRIGMYNTNGSTGTGGWLGYWASDSSESIKGSLSELPGTGTSGYWSATGVTTDANGSLASSSMTSGTYTFSLAYALIATNTLQITWSISDGSYETSDSYTDTSIGTFTFNSVGILIGGAMGNSPTANFSDLDLTFATVPEPGIYALFGVSSILFAAFSRRFRRS